MVCTVKEKEKRKQERWEERSEQMLRILKVAGSQGVTTEDLALTMKTSRSYLLGLLRDFVKKGVVFMCQNNNNRMGICKRWALVEGFNAAFSFTQTPEDEDSIDPVKSTDNYIRRKHEEWCATWKPKMDPAAAWMMGAV